MGKKLVSILLVLAMAITLLPNVGVLARAVDTVAPDGATDMSDWYIAGREELTNKVLTINDADDFRKFQGALCTYGKTFEGYTIYLTADIDLNPGWDSPVSLTWADNRALTDESVQTATTPSGEGSYVMHAIGSTTENPSQKKQFGGVFDGQGHSISSLYLNMNTGTAASLFGQVIGTATVRNLAVLDSYFGNGGDNLTSTKPLGGLFTNVPTGTTATISSCYVDIDLYERSTIKSTEKNQQAKFGGLVGYCAGTLTIEDSVYAGFMSSNPSTSTGKRNDGAAGFVGHVTGTSTAPANVTVRNSVFTGTIWSPHQRIGGFISRTEGVANVTLTNCVSLGRVCSKAGTNYIAAYIPSVLIQDSAVQNVALIDCYLRQKDTPRTVVSAGTHNGNCSITATVNGEQKYTLGMTSTAETGYNDTSFRIFTSAQAEMTAQAVLESKPIGGNTGYLSNVHTGVTGMVLPIALYNAFKNNAQVAVNAPVFTTNPADGAYDQNVGAAALTVEATSNDTLTYQWYCNEVAIDGATNATYTPSTENAGNFVYKCEVTATHTGFLGTTTATATSEAATVHVHDWTPGDCENPKTCNVDPCPVPESTATDHAFDDDCMTADKCANCDVIAEAKESHSFDNNCLTADKCANCATVAEAKEAHTYTDDHDSECDVPGCTSGTREPKHVYTDDHDTTCDVEGCTATREAIHTESTEEWKSDDNNHWHSCTGCDKVMTTQKHTDSDSDEDVLCDVCGFDMTCKHKDVTKVEGVPVSCTQDGTPTYWKCNKCGVRLSAEVDGTVLPDEIAAIPACHTQISAGYTSDATNHWKVCGACQTKLYVSAHIFADANDTKCDCGYKRTLVPVAEMITVSKWVAAGRPEAVKHVTITNLDDFKAFMKELADGTTAVLNNAYEIRTEGDVAFNGMTIYLTTDLDLNEGWTNDFNLSWDTAGNLTGNTKVTVPANKYNKYNQRIFGGMLEGQGHTITGLFINQEKSAAAQSLLGVAHNDSGFVAGVQNLTIKNSYIEGTNAGMGSLFTGVTAGTNVRISNCKIDVDLVSRYAGADKSSVFIGGLVGVAAGNVTIDSVTYSGSIWMENTNNLDYREVAGAIGSIKGGKTATTGNNVILNKFNFNGKIYCPNGQRMGLFAGRIDNQTLVSFVDSTSTGALVLMKGMYAGGFCNNIVAATQGITTYVFIDNCYYVPGAILTEGKLEQQTQMFTALHGGDTKVLYGGFGKAVHNTSAKGNCVVYAISDLGNDWSENLCLYKATTPNPFDPNPPTGDMAGLSMGFVIATMLISAMALVVLVPKKFSNK